MRARLYICDVCGEVEDKLHGGAFYVFKYKQKFSGLSWHTRHKMVMCNECFHRMLDFCRNDENIEWEESETDKEENDGI